MDGIDIARGIESASGGIRDWYALPRKQGPRPLGRVGSMYCSASCFYFDINLSLSLAPFCSAFSPSLHLSLDAESAPLRSRATRYLKPQWCRRHATHRRARALPSKLSSATQSSTCGERTSKPAKKSSCGASRREQPTRKRRRNRESWALVSVNRNGKRGGQQRKIVGTPWYAQRRDFGRVHPHRCICCSPLLSLLLLLGRRGSGVPRCSVSRFVEQSGFF